MKIRDLEDRIVRLIRQNGKRSEGDKSKFDQDYMASLMNAVETRLCLHDFKFYQKLDKKRVQLNRNPDAERFYYDKIYKSFTD